jgi:hypothetical protein
VNENYQPCKILEKPNGATGLEPITPVLEGWPITLQAIQQQGFVLGVTPVTFLQAIKDSGYAYCKIEGLPGVTEIPIILIDFS